MKASWYSVPFGSRVHRVGHRLAAEVGLHARRIRECVTRSGGSGRTAGDAHLADADGADQFVVEDESPSTRSSRTLGRCSRRSLYSPRISTPSACELRTAALVSSDRCSSDPLPARGALERRGRAASAVAAQIPAAGLAPTNAIEGMDAAASRLDMLHPRVAPERELEPLLASNQHGGGGGSDRSSEASSCANSRGCMMLMCRRRRRRARSQRDAVARRDGGGRGRCANEQRRSAGAASAALRTAHPSCEESRDPA